MTRRPYRPGALLGWFALTLAVTALMLGYGAAEFLLLVVCMPGLARTFGPTPGFLLFFLGAFVALAATVAVHEAGHFVAARLVGLAPRFAHVGPVTFTRWGRKWRVGWDPRQPWLGGRVICDLHGTGRAGLAVFLLGGVAANLLLAGAAGAGALLARHAWPQAWAGHVAVASLVFGVINLLPFRESRFDWDGLALWRVLSGPRR